MSIFSVLKRLFGRDKVKETGNKENEVEEEREAEKKRKAEKEKEAEKEREAEKEKEAQKAKEKPAKPPYKHVITHAAQDMLAAVPATIKFQYKDRIQAANMANVARAHREREEAGLRPVRHPISLRDAPYLFPMPTNYKPYSPDDHKRDKYPPVPPLGQVGLQGYVPEYVPPVPLPGIGTALAHITPLSKEGQGIPNTYIMLYVYSLIVA
ncbi:hypothetical protein F5Y11DRAFT_256615 [Daldinia sp. FL1419]|nr:hypothetical protein F5Y11DRAFT_256615 [Daldinia sp. FL1419]